MNLTQLYNSTERIVNILNENVNRQVECLESGAGIKTVRKHIAICFNDLQTLCNTAVELYLQEKESKKEAISLFNKWKHQKWQLKEKIRYYKGDEHEEGAHHNSLVKERALVNDEISRLEDQLKKLKEKREVLDKEIQSCQSVIDSNASSYETSLSMLERQEKQFIMVLEKEGVLPPQNDVDESLIIQILDQQLDLVEDEIANHQLKSKVYNRSMEQWNKVIEILTEMENNLQTALKHSNADLEPILCSAKKQLQLQDLPIVDTLIANEIDAINQGIAMVTGKEYVKPGKSQATVNLEPTYVSADFVTNTLPLDAKRLPSKLMKGD